MSAALPITDYFRDNVLVKRPYIRREWCEAAVRDPIRTEVQSHDGRIRHWIWVDGQTIHNAFPDRRFKP